jgi:beta-ribofuranosylaminobenzene 5'-phosphate synthase
MLGDLGRIHGSVGVAIQNPNLLLEASPSDSLAASGPRSSRILEFGTRIFNKYGLEGGVKFSQISDIPEHMGYGSGTQLALAVGMSISRIYNLNLTVEKIASHLERSRVSGIGTHAFKQGGFIVDGGHDINYPDRVPPLIFRINMPEDWIFVIGVPNIDPGISGLTEKKAFKEMEAPPKELVDHLSRVVLMKMIPSIIEKKIKGFGEAITELDYKFGEYWLEVQGGRFSHPHIEEGIEHLLNLGVLGAGQSSWGPAFYGLVKGENMAKKIRIELSNFFENKGRKGDVFYTKVNNEGAKITLIQ